MTLASKHSKQVIGKPLGLEMRGECGTEDFRRCQSTATCSSRNRVIRAETKKSGG